MYAQSGPITSYYAGSGLSCFIVPGITAGTTSMTVTLDYQGDATRGSVQSFAEVRNGSGNPGNCATGEFGVFTFKRNFNAADGGATLTPVDLGFHFQIA